VHVLVTAGGLTAAGLWREPVKSCLLPRRVVMELYRGKLRALLGEAAAHGELVLPPTRTLPQFRGLLNKLGRVDWNVKLRERYEHGTGVATYLARYVRGGPIGNSRLVSYQDGEVRFRYRDNRELDAATGRGRWKTLPLRVHDFLARVLEHVPPPGMHTVRSWGLYASSRGDDLARARLLLGQTAQAAVPVQLGWQEVLRRLGQDAATRCAVCGAELVTWGRFRRGERPPSFDRMPRRLRTKLHSRVVRESRPPPAAPPAHPPPNPAARPTTG
jgi:hypothetical protein